MSQTATLPNNAESSFLTMFLISFTAHVLAIILFVLLPQILPHHPSDAFGGPSGGGGLNVDWVRLGPSSKGKTSLKPKVEEEAAPSKTIEKINKEDEVELKSKTTIPDVKKKTEEVKPKATLNQPEKKTTGPFGTGKNTSADTPKTGSGGNSGKIGVGTFGAGQGGPGGYGTGTGVAFPFPWYIDRVIDKVEESWIKPYIQNSEGQNYEAVVYFVITRTGQVKDVKVEKSSNIPAMDRSAESAVYNSQPFPPLPTQWTEPDLAFRLTFDYVQE